MVQVLQAQEITLLDLSETFGLELAENEQFFPEWQDNLPELTDAEQQSLDEVKRDYIHLSQYPLLEPVVKMVVLSPLLRLAGFYRPPFYIAAEKEASISAEDEGVLIKGRIDILVFRPQLWVLVIESKRAKFSLEGAIPQALSYMLASPNGEKLTYGFITNGSEFLFLKLNREETPKYAISYPLSLRRGDDLYEVLRGLKRLREVVML
ncbi:MAG: type I restriction enzyme HsdR N-terminal domain-containing protein [Cyanobacteriota bacterium]|nr:type I restriction enzyme HsdR N-terminal domain-containing protein [Cyanobacteriota bacterium]